MQPSDQRRAAVDRSSRVEHRCRETDRFADTVVEVKVGSDSISGGKW